MVRLLGGGHVDDIPREITTARSFSNDGGWLLRFFDSAFFSEWIAVSYLYRHEHGGVRDYLCNRMYALPISGIENYLFQLCFMAVHKPSPSLEKYIADMCSKSLRISLKVHWFLLAESEDTDSDEDILNLQDLSQEAALNGDWPPLVCPRPPKEGLTGRARMLRMMSNASKRLLPLSATSAYSRQQSTVAPGPSPGPPDEEVRELGTSTGRGIASGPLPAVQTDAVETESSLKLLKKLMPGATLNDVRGALLKRFTKENEKGEVEDETSSAVGSININSDEDVENDSEVKPKESLMKFFRRNGSGSGGDDIEVKEAEDDLEEMVEGERLADGGKPKETYFKKYFWKRDGEKSDERDNVEGGDSDIEGTSEFFKKLFKKKEGRVDGTGELKKEVTDALDGEEHEEKSSSGDGEGFLRKLLKSKRGGEERDEYVEEEEGGSTRTKRRRSSFLEDEGVLRRLLFWEKLGDSAGEGKDAVSGPFLDGQNVGMELKKGVDLEAPSKGSGVEESAGADVHFTQNEGMEDGLHGSCQEKEDEEEGGKSLFKRLMKSRNTTGASQAIGLGGEETNFLKKLQRNAIISVSSSMGSSGGSRASESNTFLEDDLAPSLPLTPHVAPRALILDTFTPAVGDKSAEKLAAGMGDATPGSGIGPNPSGRFLRRLFRDRGEDDEWKSFDEYIPLVDAPTPVRSRDSVQVSKNPKAGEGGSTGRRLFGTMLLKESRERSSKEGGKELAAAGEEASQKEGSPGDIMISRETKITSESFSPSGPVIMAVGEAQGVAETPKGGLSPVPEVRSFLSRMRSTDLSTFKAGTPGGTEVVGEHERQKSLSGGDGRGNFLSRLMSPDSSSAGTHGTAPVADSPGEAEAAKAAAGQDTRTFLSRILPSSSASGASSALAATAPATSALQAASGPDQPAVEQEGGKGPASAAEGKGSFLSRIRSGIGVKKGNEGGDGSGDGGPVKSSPAVPLVDGAREPWLGPAAIMRGLLHAKGAEAGGLGGSNVASDKKGVVREDESCPGSISDGDALGSSPLREQAGGVGANLSNRNYFRRALRVVSHPQTGQNAAQRAAGSEDAQLPVSTMVEPWIHPNIDESKVEPSATCGEQMAPSIAPLSPVVTKTATASNMSSPAPDASPKSLVPASLPTTPGPPTRSPPPLPPAAPPATPSLTLSAAPTTVTPPPLKQSKAAAVAPVEDLDDDTWPEGDKDGELHDLDGVHLKEQADATSHGRPPLPRYPAFTIRKGTYFSTLDFVKALCDCSTGLVHVFPLAHRQQALKESLAELNGHLAVEALSANSGVCFPMGKGLSRVVHLAEDEAVLLNSRDKVPFMVFVEVLRCDPLKLREDERGTKQTRTASRGIPLANGDAKLSRPPPWALYMWNSRKGSQQSLEAPGSSAMAVGASRPSLRTSQTTSLATRDTKVVDVVFTVTRRRRGAANGRGEDGGKEAAHSPAWPSEEDAVCSSKGGASPQLDRDAGEAASCQPGSSSKRRSLMGGSGVAGADVNDEKSGVRKGDKADVSEEILEVSSDAFEGDSASDEGGDGLSSRSPRDGGAVEQEEWVSLSLVAVPGMSLEDAAYMDDNTRGKEHRRVPSGMAMAEVRAVTAQGQTPPGLPKATAATSATQEAKANHPLGERWADRKERLRKASKYGSSPDWNLKSMIVKSGDDCRQEHLAGQLVSHFFDIFTEAGLPLWLRPYEVLVTSSNTALIETITDAVSIHTLKSRSGGAGVSLRSIFFSRYVEGSPAFEHAQRNFVESMAGYSILCYLLQVKDRHNGNIMLDEEGHVIHIDFGYMLSNSPGGVNFENAPFKLTREFLEVMDSDAEGISSQAFDYFKVLCIQGFLTCRKHAERILLLVEMMQTCGCPCFNGGSGVMRNLRKRFQLTLTEEQCVSHVMMLINSSLDAWRTRQYDYYQRVLNGIL